jgi:hypothetical protein
MSISMPDYDLYINPQKPSVGLYVRKSAIQLLPPALSCDVEFDFTASTKSSNSSCSVASGFSSIKVVSSWRGSGFADVMFVLDLIHGRRSISPIRPVRSSDSGGRRISPRLRSCAACAVPGDGVYGFPRSLAHAIEPRAPIGKLGFTEGYPLLEIGEHMQEHVSMHAAQYTTRLFRGR